MKQNPFRNVVVFSLPAPGFTPRRFGKDDFSFKYGRDFIEKLEAPPDVFGDEGGGELDGTWEEHTVTVNGQPETRWLFFDTTPGDADFQVLPFCVAGVETTRPIRKSGFEVGMPTEDYTFCSGGAPASITLGSSTTNPP